jgi:ABC-type Na+ efflux pump permease subunit
MKLQVRQNGKWVDVTASVTPEYPNGDLMESFGTPLEIYTFTFDTIKGDGIRIYGKPGGMWSFFSVAELRVISPSDATDSAADLVKAQISALPEPDKITLADKAKVEAARKAYDSLGSAEKAKVDNYNLLVEAEARIAALTNQTGQTTEQTRTTNDTQSPETGGNTPLYMIMVLLLSVIFIAVSQAKRIRRIRSRAS